MLLPASDLVCFEKLALKLSSSDSQAECIFTACMWVPTPCRASELGIGLYRTPDSLHLVLFPELSTAICYGTESHERGAQEADLQRVEEAQEPAAHESAYLGAALGVQEHQQRAAAARQLLPVNPVLRP